MEAEREIRMVRPARLELTTLCLEGRCSIQLSYGRTLSLLVGAARFELATSCSQSRRATGLRYTPKRPHYMRAMRKVANSRAIWSAGL